jgi:hypothetical protein
MAIDPSGTDLDRFLDPEYHQLDPTAPSSCRGRSAADPPWN